MESTNDDLCQRMKEAESSWDDEKKEREALEAKLAQLRPKHKTVLNENEGLKVEVQKGVEDIAKDLNDGYDRCLKRVSSTGFDVRDHSFDDYVRDYAASNLRNQS